VVWGGRENQEDGETDAATRAGSGGAGGLMRTCCCGIRGNAICI
jgi:hypothetical protein